MRRFLGLVALLALASTASADPFSGAGYQPGLPGAAPDANEYQRDDGVAENSIGLTAGGDLFWMSRYTALANQNLITQIRIAFGTPQSLNGHAVTAFLWSDPNNDGSPADAMVLAQASGVISGANATVPINSPTFVAFDIPDTAVPVGSNFFVGAGDAPRRRVSRRRRSNRAAARRQPELGCLGGRRRGNPNALASVTDLSTIPTLNGDLLIRADGSPVPEPTSALAGGSLARTAGSPRTFCEVISVRSVSTNNEGLRHEKVAAPF